MSEIEELIQGIGQAKAYIDNGLCRVGPGLRPNERMDALLAGGASRCLALADSIVELCRRDHPTETLPALRHLTDIVVMMRWVQADPIAAETRTGELFRIRKEASWEGLWPTGRLLERTRECGIAPEDVNKVLSLAEDFVSGNSTMAPWSHIFAENQRPSTPPQVVLGLAVRMMGHCLRALDTRWPESFPGAEAMWELS